jgi:hypothetical protein
MDIIAILLAPVVTDRRRALDAFQRGIIALHAVEDADPDAADRAIVELQQCLEWTTRDGDPDLWLEAALALAEAYALRATGDPLANVCRALALYHAALLWLLY